MIAKAGPMFFGWRVVAAVFVLALFGWGFGFYGPPVYLHAVREARGWSLALVSAAVTMHYLCGVAVIAMLPRLYGRYGVAAVTKAGSIALAAGVLGWALAREPWQLFAATLLSGGGWVTMGAAAVNAIVSPWFDRLRPAALASAYNGSSMGGVVFSPLWAAAIGTLGFAGAALGFGAVMVVTIWLLADLYYARTPQEMGLATDGDAPGDKAASSTSPLARALPGRALWRDRGFVTLAAGAALGLFAQIGLLAHLFSLLVPALGAQSAGIAAGAATAAAILGRTLFGWLMPPGADRRLFACASYLVQICGSLAFLLAAGDSIPLLAVGVVLLGFGIGNATSLPPLIAQVDFAKADVARVVPMVVAIGQAAYAFAPLVFGLIREFAPAVAGGAAASAPGAAPYVFAAAAIVQAAAIATFLWGRKRKPVATS